MLHTHGTVQRDMFCILWPYQGRAMACLKDKESLFALTIGSNPHKVVLMGSTAQKWNFPIVTTNNYPKKKLVKHVFPEYVQFKTPSISLQ